MDEQLGEAQLGGESQATSGDSGQVGEVQLGGSQLGGDAGAQIISAATSDVEASSPVPAATGQGSVTASAVESTAVGSTPTPSVAPSSAVVVSATEASIAATTPAPNFAAEGFISAPASTVAAASPDTVASGQGSVTASAVESTVAATSPDAAVSGSGVVPVTGDVSIASARSITPSVDAVGTVEAAALISTAEMLSPAAEVGWTTWAIDGLPVSKLTDETRSWQELTLSFRADVSTRDNQLKPLDSHSGSVDTVVNSDGSFSSFDRAGGSNTYSFEPPINRDPPRLGGDYFVDGYDDQMVDQEGNEYEVSLTLVDDESRSTSSGLSETRSTGEWLFEFDTGSVATSRVSQRVQSGERAGEGTKQIELVLDPEQTRCLKESCTALEAVTVHEVADGPNFAVDESPGDVNTVAVTAPTGADSVLPGGSYAVNEWESEWVSEEFYRVSAELVELA